MTRNRRECRSCHRTEDNYNIICVTDHPDCHDGDYCEDCNPYEQDRKRNHDNPRCNRCAILANENEKLRAENRKLLEQLVYATEHSLSIDVSASGARHALLEHQERERMKAIDSRERKAFEAARFVAKLTQNRLGDLVEHLTYPKYEDYKKARGE